ncbi:MAG TPA: hypothetical protein VJN21_01095 [Candidatus Acidoferrales bacterium]|nr:hypothetical protein [Candidatus Acidoferrales bacterium]
MATLYATFGIRSRVYSYSFWALQVLLVMLRGSAVYEVCKVLLSPFAGVWKTGRSLLILIGAGLTLVAIVATSQTGPRISAIISTADRGLELAIVGILLFGLAFCRYYHLPIERYLAGIGLGFGFYSGVQVLSSTFLHELMLSYFPIWRYLFVFSFNIATLLWCVALWKPLPALRPAIGVLGPTQYEALAPEVALRLRELNARLQEMWK